MVHEATYAVAPSVLWQSARPEPAYSNTQLRDFHVGWELPFYQEQRSLSNLAFWAVVKVLVAVVAIFHSAGLAVPMVTLSIVVERSRWMRIIMAACAVFTAGLLVETFVQPHYSAPIVGIILLIALQGMRYLRLWHWRGIAAGRLLVFASIALCVGSFGFFLADAFNQARLIQHSWSSQRAQILERLEHDGDRHLVIVRYEPQHSSHDEWVYNEADIDGSKVVWAREMAASQNDELMEYFHGRRVWLLEADAKTPGLTPYQGR